MLSEVGIDAFLAHEDLEVSEEWQERILEELRRCNLFVPLLSASFIQSKWAPQEVGIIVSRLPGVTIAPLSIDGTRSFGFISQIQSPTIPAEGITRELLVVPLARKLPRDVLPGLIKIASEARSFRSAEGRMKPLVPFFNEFTPEEVQALADASVANGQIWDAMLCSHEYLPALIRMRGGDIKPETLRALEYQLKHGTWYIPGNPGQ